MSTPQERLDDLIAKLKTRGHRVTPQRIAILKILAASTGHPSVDQVYESVKVDFPTTSLATVYKTVTLLKEMGEILELGFGNEGNRYDGTKPYPHPHLVCIKCKKIIDPEVIAIGELSHQVASTTGFRIVSHRLDFYGICPQCQEQENEPQVYR
jgi:Fur family peroxide stress response transcriptional regulator